MNTAPALEFWWRFAGLLSLQISIMVVIAFGLQAVMASATWRRTIWQACALAVLVLVCVEANGASRMVATILSRQTDRTRHLTPPRAFSVSVMETLESGADVALPPALPIRTVAPSKHAWWPGILWLAGSALLLGRMLFIRLLFLLRARRQRTVTDPELIGRIHQLAARLGIRRPVRVIEMSVLRGPIAFGVICPAIGLPKDFSTFTAGQQEAMLIHELAHLAVRDPLWYGLVDLVVAVAWWHPLSWWMRQRLHAATEAAADDASTLVEDGPTVLAEALVQLGSRLLERQRLGLLGIGGNGFRSSLGRRVERLMRLHGAQWRPVSALSEISAKTGAPVLLLGVALLGCAWMTSRERQSEPAWKDSLAGRALGAVLHGNSAGMDTVLAAPERFVSAQSSASASTNALYSGKRRQALQAKLQQIRLPLVTYDNVPLSEVVKRLSEEARKRDPHGEGLQFLIPNLNPPIDPATGLPTPAATPDEAAIAGKALIRIVPPLSDVTLEEVLEAVVKVADRPIKYSLEEYAVVFLPRSQDTPPLRTRTFKLDPHTFMSRLHNLTTLQVPPAELEGELPTSGLAPRISLDALLLGSPLAAVRHLEATNSLNEQMDSLRQFLLVHGVDLAPPEAVFWSDRRGMLMVRATLEDLDVIERAIQSINTPPPQVTIEVKIAETPEAAVKELGLDWLGHTVTSTISRNQPRNPFVDTNSATGNYATVLTAPQFRLLATVLEQKAGVDVLTAPKVTTLSGRQTQIKVVEVKNIATGIDEKDQKGVVDLRVTKHEFGPTIDAVAVVRADGYTIDLTVIATLREFAGYEATSETVKVLNDDGTIGSSPKPLPQFRVHQAVATPKVWDGQTFAMGLGKVEGKERVAFVTVTIIDPAGNRVHSEEDGPFRTFGIPPQK
jgi:beta-lactamase regulating signal transducer with metallopeptidase domain